MMLTGDVLHASTPKKFLTTVCEGPHIVIHREPEHVLGTTHQHYIEKCQVANWIKAPMVFLYTTNSTYQVLQRYLHIHKLIHMHLIDPHELSVNT